MSKSNNKQPDFVTMRGPLTVEAADDEKNLPHFRMVAYTGGLMRIAGTQRVAVEDGKLVAEGLISRDTSWARDVAKSGINGFPWQASIGAAVIEAELVPTGGTVEVNGQTFEGPVHVVRRAILKEISFVDSGADTETSARIAAKDKEQQVMEDKQVTDASATESSKEDIKDTGQDSQHADVHSGSGDEQVQASAESAAQQGVVQANVQAAATDGMEAVDPVAEMRAAAGAEAKRIAAIRKLCDGHPDCADIADIEAKAIAEGWDQTKCELEVLRASRPKAPAVNVPQRPTAPQVFEAVGLMAAGTPIATLESIYGEQTLEAADKLRGVGIQEFCELACGRQLPRFRRDATGWLEAAFSTTSLPGILSNIANKMLLEGYNYVEDAWRRICKIASVNDFKEHSRYRMTGSFKFEQVGPDGELKHGKLDEQKYGQKADTHGIMFALTRQMIINDDMGAFTDIPRQIGMGAAEAIADAVWGLWLGNPVQSDGKAFFSTDHKNYLTGADTALSVDGLTQAEVTFGEQVKPNGRPLGIQASLLLVPTALKVPAELLMTALTLNETTTANKPKPASNPHTGKFDVVSSVYLSNPSFTGASSKAWYLLTDPNRLPALEVAFLNGIDRPTVEKTDADFNTLGIQFRGYIDFGVREQDYRGALKMKGEA